jgi:cellulose synthase/poly-beta-1,6-N-acetylglucosamine synthase-like glycosyltransferase
MTGYVLLEAGAALLLLSSIAYPLWVGLLARLRPIPVGAAYALADRLPRVTCVIAAADESALVGRKLETIREQDYPRDKVDIIVVSDGSTDDTDRIVAEWEARDAGVRLLRTGRRSGKPTALNLARPHVRTPIAVLMDVRQGLTPNAIRELVAGLADPGVAVVSGDLRLGGDAYWGLERSVRRWESASGSMVQATGSLYALRTEDLPEIPPDTILDDVYVPLLAARSGRRIVLAEGAGSLEAATRSVGSEFKRKVRTLAGLVQIVHVIPDLRFPGRHALGGRFFFHKLVRLAAPYALVLVVAGALVLGGWLARAMVAGLSLVALLALGNRLGLRTRLGRLCQSFLALNLAAVWAVPFYCLGLASVTWTRVEKDRR